MTFERPGFNPETSPSKTRHVEYKGNSYEVFDLQNLTAQQIELGDRAFITTQSGNRYLIRRSRSHGDRLFAYKESDRSSGGGELDDETLARPLASVGERLHFAIKEPNVTWESTPVTAIEIRKGIDKAIEEAKTDGESLGSLAGNLIDRAHGRRRVS